jgi:cell filamentation protein
MDKYDVANDPYCYNGSGVLVNKLNITAEKTLEDAVRYQPPPYNLDYFRLLHRVLFKDLYDWAGDIRTVDIAKGGTRFCTCSRVVPEIDKLFLSLANENWLMGLTKLKLSEKLAECYCEFNMIHPFREGNGRVQRVFFEHLALSAGYELDWFDVTSDEWIQANIDGVAVNYSPMEAIFSRVLF